MSDAAMDLALTDPRYGTSHLQQTTPRVGEVPLLNRLGLALTRVSFGARITTLSAQSSTRSWAAEVHPG
jgi:hypothetical protein